MVNVGVVFTTLSAVIVVPGPIHSVAIFSRLKDSKSRGSLNQRINDTKKTRQKFVNTSIDYIIVSLFMLLWCWKSINRLKCLLLLGDSAKRKPSLCR